MLEKDGQMLSEADPLLTREALAEYLRKLGLPISISWLEKLYGAEGEGGPPIECYWGRRPMTRRSQARAWAQDRLRKNEEQQPDRVCKESQ